MWKSIGIALGILAGGFVIGLISRGPDLSAELADAERRYHEALSTLERAEDGLHRIGETLGASIDGLEDLDESIERASRAAERAIDRARDADSRTGELQERIGELEAAVAVGASLGAGASLRHGEIEDLIGRILSGGSGID